MLATRSMAVVCVVVCSLLAACGSSQGEVAVPSSSAEELAAGAIGIWDDALGAGWSDWSWGNARSSTSSPVASGSAALSVTFSAWGGLYFRRSAGSVSGMSALQLSVNGGSTAGNKLAVHAVQGTTDLPAVSLAPYCTGA